MDWYASTFARFRSEPYEYAGKKAVAEIRMLRD
jgi:hypothetical protein